MTVTDHIISFASRQEGSFKRKDLVNYLEKEGILNESSLSMQLDRLVSTGKLQKVGWGEYSLAPSIKPTFQVVLTAETLEIGHKLKNRYPFAEFCIWEAAAVIPFMLHVPNVQMVIVDAERFLEQTFFDALKEMYPQYAVLPDPSKDEYYKYGSGKPCIIVHPLITEAPVGIFDDLSVPHAEKLLVDIITNPEFDFAEGRDLHYIYSNIVKNYSISHRRLLRYARRRSCEDKVVELLNPEHFYD